MPLTRAFKDTVKARATEWEGRYNWTPVAFENPVAVRNTTGNRNAPTPPAATPKAQAEPEKASHQRQDP